MAIDYKKYTDLQIESRIQWDQADRGMQTDFLGGVFQPLRSMNKKLWTENGVLGQAQVKLRGQPVVFASPSAGGEKTTEPTRFALGVKAHWETVNQSTNWPVVTNMIKLLRRAMWTRRQERQASLFNNATGTTGRYAIDNSVAEGWASNAHTVGALSGYGDNIATAAAAGYSAFEDLVSILANEKDGKGDSLGAPPRFIICSTLLVANKAKSAFRGATPLAPTLDSADVRVSGQNRSETNILQQEYGNVEIRWSPYFDSSSTSWYAALGPEHMFVEHRGTEVDLNQYIENESYGDLCQVADEFVDWYVTGWRQSVYNAGT